jgi:hypothetical protein
VGECTRATEVAELSNVTTNGQTMLEGCVPDPFTLLEGESTVIAVHVTAVRESLAGYARDHLLDDEL